jgi:hypothetical protein
LRIPLTYERAPGGYAPSPSADPQRPQFSATNPVGRGFVPAAGEAAPNIESLGSSSSATPVAGFGAIAFHWQSRAGHAGTYDAAWQRDRMPLYPDDLDDRFFLASPEDQRPKEFLNGGEPVELFNLSPTGQQTFVLPKIALRFETEFRDGPAVNHRGNLYSVILEPDESRVVMVWRTSLRVHARALKLERTTITQLRVINAPSGSVPLDAEAGDIDSGELAA